MMRSETAYKKIPFQTSIELSMPLEIVKIKTWLYASSAHYSSKYKIENGRTVPLILNFDLYFSQHLENQISFHKNTKNGR